MGELSPGSTPRRWIPEGGLKKHRERIHRESKQADEKNLPFSFSKPKRDRRMDYFGCTECGRIFSATINTIMVVCPDYKKVTKAVRIMDDETMACMDDRPEQV